MIGGMGPAYVDGLLEDWGEKFFDPTKFWGTPGKAAGAKNVGGARARQGTKGGGGGGAIRKAQGRLHAATVRGRLSDIVRKRPKQAVVKLYKGGRGMRQIRKHIAYIAREGEVTIEDQDGLRTKGADALREIADDWQHGEVRIAETSSKREALNMALSMPEGVDPIAVQKAARDFAEKEFSNHKYVMALHTADTPHSSSAQDDPPTPNPHVHLIVQTAGLDGSRLNPRKADLHRWREEFAKALRAHGVDAVATSRAHRLDRGRGEKQSVRHMKAKKKPFTKTRVTAGTARVDKAQQTERTILQRYAEVVEILSQSEDRSDQVLANELADKFRLQRRTRPPPEKVPEHWPRREAADEAFRGRTGTDDLER